jgi:FtsH-binding integral membrane protein
MELVIFVLSMIGLVLTGIGGIWLLIAAFSEHIFWGLACMFLPFASLVFLLLRWDKAAVPFGVGFLGLLLLLIGGILSGRFVMV